MIYQILSEIFGVLICLFIVRVFIVSLRIRKKKIGIDRTRFTAKLMVVLGSGGHTFEMLHLIRNIHEKINPRIYVLAETDNLSAQKAKKFEEVKGNSEYVLEKIPRSREVGQSWITSFFTTLKACFSAFQVVYRHWPDAVLCNGPGTCIPVCLSAVFLHGVLQTYRRAATGIEVKGFAEDETEG